MTDLAKLSALAALCFSMIVFGACGGGDGGGGGGYSGGSAVAYPDCQKYLGGSWGVADPVTGKGREAYASCTATSTHSTTVTNTANYQFTVTNSITYFHTGTSTEWRVYTGTSTSF